MGTDCYLKPADAEFYNKFIFLEDHIAHKDGVRVVKWKNIFPNDDEGTLDNDVCLQKFPDASAVFNDSIGDADYTNIEVLDEYKDLVLPLLNSTMVR
uniref:Uncharacterized protein n=1 Tax=Trichogramma kaykai TaxID=54128 RepID=A0ABD2WYU0_9HYME